MRTQVSRENLTIKLNPQKALEPGAIFFYNGPLNRLKGYVLIHRINPKLDALSARDGKDIFSSEHVVAEVLIPEKGYSDYCLFWVEKRFLQIPEPKNLLPSRFKITYYQMAQALISHGNIIGILLAGRE